jgi:hypothetical protein
MTHRGSMNLIAEWRAFFAAEPDARLIVNNAMERTGFTEDEVLLLLIEAWAEQNLTPEQQREFDEWVRPAMSVN